MKRHQAGLSHMPPLAHSAQKTVHCRQANRHIPVSQAKQQQSNDNPYCQGCGPGGNRCLRA